MKTMAPIWLLFASCRATLAQVLLGQEVNRHRLLIRCAVMAAILVVGMYPDVIFFGASLSTVNIANITGEPAGKKISIFPEPAGRQVWDGYYDFGGAAFQSEPNAQFMKRSIWNGESVYWNPYSAAGSYGIETLVDVKTSPLSMTVALLGGSDAVFELAYLGFSYLGVFCLLILLTMEFRLSLASATAGGITYLLNGFHVASLASNVSQTWLYFPLFILGLVKFANRPSLSALLTITAGAVLILATTFLPTTLMITVTSVFVGAAAALGVSAAEEKTAVLALARTARIIAGQIAGTALALPILAVVWLPVIEALRYMATGAFYDRRIFYPANMLNFISMFTPKHAFESYMAITPRAAAMIGNAAFHQGIVGALIALQALRRRPLSERVLLGSLGIVLIATVARIYGVWIVGAIVDLIPVIGHVGEQYLWVTVAVLFTLLVPFGFESILKTGVRKSGLAIGSLVIMGALGYTVAAYGVESSIALFYICVAVALVVVTDLVLALYARVVITRCTVAVILMLLPWTELTFYVDHLRLTRTDRFADPPPFVRFLQSQHGFYRTASYGQPGMPPELGSAFGVYQIGSMTFQLFPRYESIFNRLLLPDPSQRWTSFASLVLARDADSLNLAAFDFLGTQFLVVPKTFTRLIRFMEQSAWQRVYSDQYVQIFKDLAPLPRAFITHRVVENSQTPVDLGQSPLALATSDDPELLAAAHAAGISDAKPMASVGDERTTITQYRNASVEIDTELHAPGILVLNDAWHPNWIATVDGRPSRIGIVNEAFRGVVLEPGQHIVKMSYAPRSLGIAKWISVLTIGFVLALLLMSRRMDAFLMKIFRASALPCTAFQCSPDLADSAHNPENHIGFE